MVLSNYSSFQNCDSRNSCKTWKSGNYTERNTEKNPLTNLKKNINKIKQRG